jgi:dTDP-4-amino-4,6-dideoxygalactose transaminase
MNSSSTNKPVPLLDVNRGNAALREQILKAITDVVDSGRFLHGPHVSELEQKVAEICEVKHAIGCASGSDALLLALMALNIGPGDEVIVPSFTFFATASCVERLGAKIVFADIEPDTYNISVSHVESLITRRTKAIIPVHLFGQCARIDDLCALAHRHNIPVVEDAAQAIGASYAGKSACSWGDIGCLSFYPTKNLGGFGDAGMLTCQDDMTAARLRLFAAHGMQPRYYHREVGINSRLDTIQAAVLSIKIDHLAEYTKARQAHAARYRALLAASHLDDVCDLPAQDAKANHVFNQFGIRVHEGRRDALKQYLQARNIGCEIYYPVPLHMQTCFRHLGYKPGSLPVTERASAEILHLPIYPELAIEEQLIVVEAMESYFDAGAMQRVA